jgi:DNA-directed RNA polymerase subunit N (RpoN/RPB10)
VAVSRFLGEQFQEWYSALQRSRNKIQMAVYCNMRLRKHMYINGSRYNLCEPVMPELLVLDFGIDNTRCRRLIMSVLENVKTLESEKYKLYMCIFFLLVVDFGFDDSLCRRLIRSVLKHVERETGRLKIKQCTD